MKRLITATLAIIALGTTGVTLAQTSRLDPVLPFNFAQMQKDGERVCQAEDGTVFTLSFYRSHEGGIERGWFMLGVTKDGERVAQSYATLNGGFIRSEEVFRKNKSGWHISVFSEQSPADANSHRERACSRFLEVKQLGGETK